ncbi:MAG: cytochrome b [Cocleimonas sp.]|nr:cytochrome b [Cocleimonas sp.]
MLKNTKTSFGLISRSLHWIMALLLTGLFAMGLYMTSLDYYDPLYHSLPWWHKSLGLFIFFLLLLRIIWKLSNPQPESLTTHQQWERRLAHFIQKLFYLLLFFIALSGYFISTAKDKGIAFFNLFELPSIIALQEETAELIGDTHELMAISLAVFVVLHALAALKHHFIDKDKTLTRMIKSNDPS